MALTKQEELDAIYARMSTQYGRFNERQQAYAIREIGRIRGDMAIMLADYAGDDGLIARTRLTRLMRDLDDIERQLRKYGTVALDEIITQSADWTTGRAATAIERFTGASITATTQDRINRDVFRYVTKRFGDDGLVLSRRVWATSAEIREELSSVLRSGIIRGESVNSLVAQVRRVYANETWKIKRLVVTEGNTAYRAANAMSAERSEIVQWVRINDNPGLHKNHEAHRCYLLAHEDRYAQGPGVFKPTDSEIYAPHPNCRSYITPVLDPKYL